MKNEILLIQKQTLYYNKRKVHWEMQLVSRTRVVNSVRLSHTLHASINIQNICFSIKWRNYKLNLRVGKFKDEINCGTIEEYCGL